MQAGGRFVQHVDGVASLRALQLGRQLDALRFTAGQFGGRLAETQIAQPHFAQHLQRSQHAGIVGKEDGCLIHRHLQHLRDVATA